MILKYKNFIVSICVILFITTYFLPFYSFTEKTLTGFELYFFQLAEYAFIETIFDYLCFLLNILVLVWVILLFYWSFKRSSVKLYKLIPVIILAISSSLFWYFQLEDRSGVAYGYWLWVISITIISIYSIYRSFKEYVIIKENTATN
jgi:hypothetical protein